ncbi:MAG: efflux RND transporter permease subunit [Bacteroidales bacterium]
MSIYSTSVKKPISTALIFLAVVIVGLFSLSRLSIDLLPHIETNAIMVITAYPGASAADIETNVTKPMENTLNTVNNLKHIKSDSKENMSVVTLEFEYGTDIDVATNDVRDRLDIVKSALPDNVENPLIYKFGSDDIPIILLSVTAEESMPALYKIIDDKVANPLKRISGVGSVSISGAPEREIQVYCDPQKLEAYKMTIESIASTIAQENRNVPGGNIDLGSSTYSLRVQGEFSDAYQMKDIVLGTYEGKVIYLHDVARINDTIKERQQEAYTNGGKGGMIVIQKQSGANSVQIANAVKAKLPEIQKSLPSDVKIGEIMNTSISIENTIKSLSDTIFLTFFIVMLVVLFFLGRWRATIIIIITIPISLISAFIYLLLSGNTLNIISLSSLSIAIGMVVDDAIVVLENVTNHIERGSDPKQAAVHGTNEVGISVIASTLTMLAVFLPLTMITGRAGILFRQLGWIVSIIMIISTVCALSLTPMLCSQWLRINTKESKLHKKLFTPIEKFLNSLDNGYVKLLAWAIHHRTVVVTGYIAIFIMSLFMTKYISTEFFPTQDNGRISMNIELPVGTRVEKSRNLALDIDRQLRQKYPEILVTNFTVGQSDTDDAWSAIQDNGTHLISYNIRLTSVGERKRGIIEISDLIRKDLDKYPEIKTFTVIAGGSSGMSGQATADVEVYGYDFENTDKIANELASHMRDMKSCSGVHISRSDYIPEYQVDFDREKLALNGLNTAMAASFLRNRINGTRASYYREDGDEYDITVRYAPEFRQSIEDVKNIVVYNSKGEGIRIRELGKVRELMTPPTIERKDRERIVIVSGYVAKGYALGDLVGDVQKKLDKTNIPSDISINIGGTYEDQKDTFGDLTMLGVLIIILVFIVLASQFESLTDPFIIMFSLPFAFTGVFIGLLVTGTPLGVMAMIGVIMLAGIVVKNGIVLIDYTILNRERGLSITRAVLHAGRSRLRPVLMTTLTTVLGMVPLAVGMGEGSELWQSMGLAVAWGLSLSTLITLLIVPTIYCIFAKNGVIRHRHKMAKMRSIEN